MRAIITIALVSALVVAATAENYCIQKNPWRIQQVSGNCDSQAVLSGEYNKTLMTVGWDTMRVVTNAAFADEDQAYALGYFEGYNAQVRMRNMFDNQLKNANTNPKVLNYFNENIDYVRTQSQAQNKTSPFWFQVGLITFQAQGMFDGYNAAAPAAEKFSTLNEIWQLASQGDLLDLNNYWPPTGSNPEDWRKMNSSAFDLYLTKKTHCSALVKVTPGMEDIYFGHATWQSFTFAIRIYKVLTLNYKSTKAKTLSFSSYAGALSSTDDFYMMDSGFAVIETSLNVFNMSIYNSDTIKSNSVLSWMRVMAANLLATSGSNWVDLFKTENSGTYNNQWIVVDLNLFTPKSDILPNTLWIAEQMPGVVTAEDMSGILQYGYWPSYNVPNFKDIFDLAGYPEAIKAQGGEMLDYQTCVRAIDFRMLSPTVTTMDTMKSTMQYNQFMVDGISLDHPGWAIASRFDLTPSFIGQAQTFGAIDAKISNYELFKQGFEVQAYSGPTPQQATFSFATTKAQVSGPHVGVPETFNFTWHSMVPLK